MAWDLSWEGGNHPGVEGDGLVHTEGLGSMGVKISSIHHQAESMKCKKMVKILVKSRAAFLCVVNFSLNQNITNTV